MQARTHNGVPFRILNVMDEYSRECLASRAARRLTHHDVMEILTELFVQRGVPVHIRSDKWSGVHRQERAQLAVKAADQTAVY